MKFVMEELNVCLFNYSLLSLIMEKVFCKLIKCKLLLLVLIIFFKY